MTNDFLRQRRNLYIVTGILFFSFLAKVNASKLTVVGISFEDFGNPEVFYTFLWLIWFYFLYRFFVYFIEDEIESFLKLWRREIGRYTNPKLEKIARENSKFEYMGNGADYYVMKRRGWKFPFQEAYEHETQGQKLDNREVKINYSQMMTPLFFGIVRFCLVTPAITNYILPVMLSLFLFFSAGFSSWEGALLHIVN